MRDADRCSLYKRCAPSWSSVAQITVALFQCGLPLVAHSHCTWRVVFVDLSQAFTWAVLSGLPVALDILINFGISDPNNLAQLRFDRFRNLARDGSDAEATADCSGVAL